MKGSKIFRADTNKGRVYTPLKWNRHGRWRKSGLWKTLQKDSRLINAIISGIFLRAAIAFFGTWAHMF
jgi:hypothetical protein